MFTWIYYSQAIFRYLKIQDNLHVLSNKCLPNILMLYFQLQKSYLVYEKIGHITRRKNKVSGIDIRFIMKELP